MQAARADGHTGLPDIEATRKGLKSYKHGVNYNGNVAPTITNGVLISVDGSNFMPYQMQDGSWRLRGNFRASVSPGSRGGLNFAINGITTAAYVQTGACSHASDNAPSVIIAASTNTISCSHSTVSTSSYTFSFDIELASKPTWAY